MHVHVAALGTRLQCTVTIYPPPPTHTLEINQAFSLANIWSLLTEEIDIERGTQLHIQSLFEADVPDVVGTAAAAGDSATLKRYLTKNPHEVLSSVHNVM